MPAALDIFSTDIYHTDGELDGWVEAHVRPFYETYIYPRLQPGQQVMLVPGSFGSNVNHYPNGTYVCDKACYDTMCAHDALDFLSWAKADPKVVAIMPWNWAGCPPCNGSRWTPPDTCCMDELGTDVMPLAQAAWAAVGREIIGGAPPPLPRPGQLAANAAALPPHLPSAPCKALRQYGGGRGSGGSSIGGGKQEELWRPLLPDAAQPAD